MIVLNGESRELPAAPTVLALIQSLGLAAGVRGVAVAVDGEVVPRAAWESREIADGSRIEVLTAMQGG